MPVKRRKTKVRQIDELDIRELMYGPGKALINGCGYMPAHKFWRDVPDAERVTILAEMKADWQRHHRTVWEHWHARDEHGLYLARQYHGDPSEPWAQTQFGDPE